MIVMLSVHTPTTVHERQNNSSNNNNNIKTINPLNDQLLQQQLPTLQQQPKAINIDNTIEQQLSKTKFNNLSIDKAINLITPPTIRIDKDTIINDTTTVQPKTNFILTELNNFKKPPTVQVPVATILNDLSPIPGQVKDNNLKNTNPISPMTPIGLQNNTPDVKAMRYYRLWIYVCNAVLLMAVIVFCGVTGKVLLADYKRLLVNGLNLTQPSFIYAYLALLVQSGFLQLVGCLGALRLSEKLLNAYWLLLLVLLIGDAILGIFWMFKFDKIMHELQPMLRYRLAHEYGNSIELTELWDRLQNEGRCCGVTGPQDFTTNSNRSYPTSCCTSDITEQISISRRPLASPVVFRNEDITISSLKDQQQKNFTDITDMAWNRVITAAQSESKPIATCRAVYPQGCIDKMITWLRHTADILFVLGYCVIAFLKLCFLGILRYEIKEMIQKIKLLQTEMSGAILGECEQFQQLSMQPQQTPNINGGIHAEPKVGNRDRERTRIGSIESERESLLVHENTPKLLKHRQLYTCINEQTTGGGGGIGGVGGGGGCTAIGGSFGANYGLRNTATGGGCGCDSDTNSNCALIGEDANTTTASTATTKTINGNNNYELCEFDAKAPTYRLLNAPTVTKI